MDSDILKIIVIILLGLILYILIIKGVLKDSIKLKDNYTKFLKRYALTYNSNNIENPLRDDSFFYMTNDGDDPCDLKKDIEYVDYIENCCLYMEIEEYDKDN